MLYIILLAVLFVAVCYSVVNRGPSAHSVRSDMRFLEFGLKDVEEQAKQIDPSSPEKEAADKHLVRARFILDDALEKDADPGFHAMSGQSLTEMYKNILSAMSEVSKARQILRPFFPDEEDDE